MNTIAHDEDRVKEATPSSINEKIDEDAWQRIASYLGKTEAEISARIHELNKEWDIERYLGVNMSTLALSGLVFNAATKNKNWLMLPTVVLGFFMQHAIQGWCPPLPLLRKLNIRTSKEIEQEKYALKLIRGDFDNLNNVSAEEMEKLKQALKKS